MIFYILLDIGGILLYYKNIKEGILILKTFQHLLKTSNLVAISKRYSEINSQSLHLSDAGAKT